MAVRVCGLPTQRLPCHLPETPGQVRGGAARPGGEGRDEKASLCNTVHLPNLTPDQRVGLMGFPEGPQTQAPALLLLLLPFLCAGGHPGFGPSDPCGQCWLTVLLKMQIVQMHKNESGLATTLRGF